MPDKYTQNAALVSKFIVEVGGMTSTGFKQVTMPARQKSIIETREGGDPGFMRTQPGLEQAGVITLMKELQEGGADVVQEWVDWYDNGGGDKRSGAVILLDRAGNEISRSTFTNGWLSRMKAPDLDATSQDGTSVYEFDISVATYKVES